MEKQTKNIHTTICPNCKLSTAKLLDYKKSTEENLIYFCHACGNVFTTNNPLIKDQKHKEK